jgi:cellulose synthase/poly-beta-1,6-N-acetylglucosamine synthase-like glycosyltransferase
MVSFETGNQLGNLIANWILSQIHWLQVLMLLYFVSINLVYLFLFLYSFFAVLHSQEELEAGHLDILLKSDALPTVSIIVPVFNEATNIVFCIQTLLNLTYRNKNLIIINDGSTDDTLDALKRVFRLSPIHAAYQQDIPTKQVLSCYQSQVFPNLMVVNKANGGKADAINAGINACQSDFFISIDADTLIVSEEMNRLMRFIVVHPDMKAAGGTIRVANGCQIHLRGIQSVNFPTNLLAGVQVIEYLRGFLFGRVGWKPLGGSIVISGAFSLFNSEVVKKIGGFDVKSIGEDMEITVRYKQRQAEVGQSTQTGFIPQPIAWTEVPEKLKVLSKQRVRWHIGLIQVLWKHRKMIFNPRYGVTGLITIPFFVFGEMLAPVFEAIGVLLILVSLIFGLGNPLYTFYLILFSIGFMVLVNIYVVLLDLLAFQQYTQFKNLVKMLAFCVLESVGYRQLTILWRLKAFYRVMRGAVQWDVVVKTGIKKSQHHR